MLVAASKNQNKDIRDLDITEVCTLGNWLTDYIRLDLANRETTDSKQLLKLLVGNSREYQGDGGLFGLED